jgi:hypothetical protein
MYKTPTNIADAINIQDNGDVGDGRVTMKAISRLAHTAMRRSDVPEYRILTPPVWYLSHRRS